MLYKSISKADIKLSAVGLGTWVFGGEFWGGSDFNDCVSAVHSSIDGGVNLIDVSPFYGDGRSEDIVGRALKGKRDKAVIATKCGLLRDGYSYSKNLCAKNIKQEAESSLKRLCTDYIDIYQTHWPDSNISLEETFCALEELKQEGKIRYIGICNADLELIKKITGLANIVSVQNEFSLLQSSKNAAVMDFCEKNGLFFLGYGALGGGFLTGKYKKQPSFKGVDARKVFYKYYLNEQYARSKKILAAAQKVSEHNGVSVLDTAIDFSACHSSSCCALAGARNSLQATQNANAKTGVLTKEQRLVLADL